jgi:hypothetical protein
MSLHFSISIIIVLRIWIFDSQVKELARIRDEEGYIAESKKDSKSDGNMSS